MLLENSKENVRNEIDAFLIRPAANKYEKLSLNTSATIRGDKIWLDLQSGQCSIQPIFEPQPWSSVSVLVRGTKHDDPTEVLLSLPPLQSR